MKRVDSEFKTRGALRSNSPVLRSSFIGRKHEIREVTQLLTLARLVTLTGAAGCGKTRLALRVAGKVSGQYADGAHWIELVRLADASLIPQTIAKALRIPEKPDRSSLERLLDALQDKQLLLVLDNCEHLLDECARLVENLLAETDASILVTSREPLRIMGERLFPVPPLSLPPRTLSADDADEIRQFDAIRLFVERARAILPTFELTKDNASAVASICRKLDGIPLAIELASARLNVLTAEQIAARLDDLFALLPSVTPAAYSHHGSLRAAIEWSHDLLLEPEQVLLRRLSVFAGGCSRATAETVCVGEEVKREQVLELLSSLVNKSLVVADTLQRGEARCSLLETIRQYAQEQLLASGERSVIRDRHLQCFLQLAEETEPKLRGEYQQLWLDWLEGEYDNVRAALADLELRQGHLQKAAGYWRKALAAVQDQDHWGRLPLPLTGWVYIRLGELLYERNELAQAWEHQSQGLERVELGGDVRALIAGYVIAARLQLAVGDLAAATAYLEKARPLVEQAQFAEWRSRFERCQLELWLAQDKLRTAVNWADAMLQEDALAERPESEVAELAMARVLILKGDGPSFRQARWLLERLLQTAQDEGRLGVHIEALALQALGHERQGERPQALIALEQALRLAEPEEYVRLFADLGLPLARLLQVARSRAMLPDYVARLLAAFSDGLPSPALETLPEPLTAREQEVLELLAAGLANRQIATHLVISPQTVKKHTGSIYGKLDVSNRTEAAARAREVGLLD